MIHRLQAFLFCRDSFFVSRLTIEAQSIPTVIPAFIAFMLILQTDASFAS
ncbi:hypothetical protein [Faecalispora sporosphaeroides]|nr:hypothetical protein [Faecalispora sporosphaeroides]